MKKKQTGSKTGSDAYAKAGVNLAAGDVFSAYAGEIGRASFKNSPYVEVLDWSKGHFRGPRGWRYKGLPEGYVEVAAPDGIGTATIITSAAGAHRTASSRLLAMTAGDITRYGGLPLVFTNVLEAKKLGEPCTELFGSFQTMLNGLGHYAKSQGYVLMGGETAEMSDCVSSEIGGPAVERMPIYNWSGVMLGVNHPDKVISGQTMKSGQRVIALRDGLRSNGGSQARAYLRQRFSEGYGSWWLNPAAKGVIADMASPAVLYDYFLATVNGWHNETFDPLIRMHAIAHISGGGIPMKFGQDVLFRCGLSAVLDDLWRPPQFMADCVRDMKIGDAEAYTIFNGGQGALVVIDDDDIGKFLRLANTYSIEAYPAGYIYKSHSGGPRLKITSKFSGKEFVLR